jgi:TolB-like protein
MRRSCTQRWGAGLCLVSCLALATEYGVAAAQDGVTSLNEMVAGSRVSIVTFGNISGVADSGWFGDGIAEAVAADLSRAADVLIDRRDATAPVLDTADAASRGREANARWVIHGGYQQQGSQIRITARLIDTESGAVVRAATVDGRLDELFALQDQIVPALGDGGTERTASVEADPGPPPTTRSLPEADSPWLWGRLRRLSCLAR